MNLPGTGLTSSERWSQRSMRCARRGWGGSPGVSGCPPGPSRKKTRRCSRGGARSCRTVPDNTAVALRMASSDLEGWHGELREGPQRVFFLINCPPPKLFCPSLQVWVLTSAAAAAAGRLGKTSPPRPLQGHPPPAVERAHPEPRDGHPVLGGGSLWCSLPGGRPPRAHPKNPTSRKKPPGSPSPRSPRHLRHPPATCGAQSLQKRG